MQKLFRRYSEKEKQFIRDTYHDKSDEEIAGILGRTLASVRYQVQHMRLLRGGRKPWVWTEELDKKMRELYPTRSDKEVAKLLGLTPEVVKSRASNIKLRKAPGYKRQNPNALTESDLQFIREHYDSSMTIDTIAERIGRGSSTVQQVCARLGLKAKVNTGCFKKGNRPLNFRQKSPGLAIGRMGETQFKKGQQPMNTLHDLAITVRYDHLKSRKGRPYKWIRIAKGKWIHYHRYLWEQANGPIPPKHVIIFHDGDTMNCVLSNLRMITHRENLERNQVHQRRGRCAIDLTDNYIAGRIAKGDKKLRNALIIAAPELIEAKRTQLKLKRLIQNERSNEAREAGR